MLGQDDTRHVLCTFVLFYLPTLISGWKNVVVRNILFAVALLGLQMPRAKIKMPIVLKRPRDGLNWPRQRLRFGVCVLTGCGHLIILFGDPRFLPLHGFLSWRENMTFSLYVRACNDVVDPRSHHTLSLPLALSLERNKV